MITSKEVIIPIFRYRLKIVVADSMKEAKDAYPDISDITSKGMLIDYGNKSMIIVPPNDTMTILHECEHAKNAIWKRIGFIPTPENDEPDAYLIEYIYMEVIKVVNKHLTPQY